MTTPPNPTILVVDDDHSSLASLRDVLEHEGYRVLCCRSGTEALESLPRCSPNLVLTDLRMREIDGMRVLEAVRELQKDIPVIVMTAFTSMETAVEAILNGAYDYLSKPFKLDHLRMVVRRALEQSALLKENRRLRALVEGQQAESEIIGQSAPMLEIFKRVGRVAPLSTTVLIQGESGTGKEIIARSLHKASGRTGPFLAVNCAALSENLLESELFGHVRGAFTGATAHKIGIFEAAQGGTCFLDEVSNMSMPLQTKLLRVLEEREIIRVGSTASVRIDARVAAAANIPLESLVKGGRFREDLYYRLKVVTIDLPPLRERRTDIPLFLDYFIRRYARAAGKEIAVDRSFYPLLCEYPWPGNVRELSHAVERAVALNSGGILTLQDFPEQYHSDRLVLRAVPVEPEAVFVPLCAKERQYIQEVLTATGQNVKRTAEILRVDRRTLYRLLKRHRLRS